jgi:serine/threonine protein kinase
MQISETDAVDLGHFRVERVLGEGGFGKVKYVVKRDSQCGFAMKCLDKHRVLANNHTAMVHKERSILIDLSIPQNGRRCAFLTNLHYAFQDAHTLYLVMDVALGGTLKYHLKRTCKGFVTGHAKFYAAQIYQGLAYLHGKLILFRDCKPENMLLNGQGNVMISDFGISEKLESRAAQMKGRTGTKVYMPPEPAQGLAFGFEFDWWTFGVTLFELLSK